MNIEDVVARLAEPKRLVCGVAAAMADKFDWSCKWTRVVWAVATFMNPAFVLLVYFVLALVMPKWQAPSKF
ncbi:MULTISPECIES: PspC domain-containing protein [Shewanella]|uniref:PspC domain-containing protein n=1 Tax=Shewanella TaxID=22 RepID=UPI0004BC4863|nr:MULTISPECIES: PspC domain-containing protein [Shewanella]